MGEVRYRVSGISIGFMVAIAAVLDLLQFLLTLTVVGVLFAWLVSVLAFCVFAIWFLLLGVNYFQGRKAGAKVGTMLTTGVIEFVPLLSGLPTITVGVIAIALLSRKEDREEAKAQPAGSIRRLPIS